MRLAIYSYSIDARKIISLSLLKRITYIISGLIMQIPIIGTIIYVALRALFNFHPDSYKAGFSPDDPYEIVNQTDNEQLKSKIDEANSYRDQAATRDDPQAVKRAQERKALNIEGFIEIEPSSADHFTMDFDTIDHDHAMAFSKERVHPLNGFKITELPALLQGDPENALCGYYALFFLLQAVTRLPLNSRDTFRMYFYEWAHLIAKKRIAGWLQNQDKIPYSVKNVSVKGINNEELGYLIQQSKFLDPVRQMRKSDSTSRCLFLELSSTLPSQTNQKALAKINPDYNPVYDLIDGKHIQKPNSKEEGKSTLTYCILQSAKHCYLMIINGNTEFSFAHSLSTPVKETLSLEICHEITNLLATIGVMEVKGKSKQS